TVKSAGNGEDNVKAAATTNINVTHLSTQDGGLDAGVVVAGGNNVTVNTAAGNVDVGNTTIANVNPTGAVNVTAANTGTVNVFGGTTVTVNDAGQNSTVNVGVNGTAVSPSEPTGAVSVNATGSGTTVNVFGGTDVSVSTVGGNAVDAGGINIGGVAANTVYAPTGNVTVNVNEAKAYAKDYLTGVTSGYQSNVSVLGGANVSVTTNAGNVTIGGIAVDAAGKLLAGENATGTVTVTETSNVSRVNVYGGTDVTVNAAGGAVHVGNVAGTVVATPSGAVTINNTASAAYDGIVNTNNGFVAVEGGTDVNVTTNAGGVRVGSSSGTAGAQPTGSVTVTDTTAGFVGVFGGSDVTVSSAGGLVIVGNDNAGASTKGDVSVTQSAVETGGQYTNNSAVNVAGGDNVTVNTTGGNVTVGSEATPTTGAVSITDTYVGYNVDNFTVVGGTTVAITTTATDGDIDVGNVTAVIDSVTGALKNASDYASGNVTIVNESKAGTSAAGASNVYGTGDTSVTTNGATSVSITGGESATITDIQTQLTKGVSTLSNVTLDHVEGNSTITSDALTSLTVLNGISGYEYTIDNTTKGHDLSLTIGGDAPVFGVDTIIDTTAGAVTLADNGVASGRVDLQLDTATSVTVNTTAAVNLTVDAGANLTTVTLNNTAALNLSVDGATSLASIDASAATGGVTVEVDPTLTSFKGGAGNDVVTIDSNSLLHADETTYSTISGGAGNNTLVANYAAQTTDTALGSNSHISGFTTLALGESAKSDNHTGSVYVAGTPTVTGVAQVSTITFDQVTYNTDGNVSEDVYFTITVGANVYNISPAISTGETAAALASAVASAILSQGIQGFSVGVSNGVVTVTGPANGTAFSISTPVILAGSGDLPPTVATPTAPVAAVTGTPADASYDASGFTALQVGQTTGDVAFTKVAAGTTLDVTASQGNGAIVNYLL
ncbi:beta strand repeat-containing protein, partial [Paraburkholderia unamae]|uniref:beta strand repeat-containing protein n=1 Tax=Paraburkholderia unamae TaxID=219649 RepID=UPI003FD8D1F6